MNPTQIGNRCIVIGHSQPATQNNAARQLPQPHATFRRIIVIKYGELVGPRPQR